METWPVKVIEQEAPTSISGESMSPNPKLKAKSGNAMNEGMIAPYKKVLEQCEKENRSR